MPSTDLGLHVVVDASNIRVGGGLTALVETVGRGELTRHGIARLTVWGSRDTLAALRPRSGLEPRWHPWLDGPLPLRIGWQATVLPRVVRDADVLFVPGGTYSGGFRPFVTMAQNLLPFDRTARARYPWSSLRRLRLAVLHRTQGRTFRRASSVVFLSAHGRHLVESEIGDLTTATVIPLGATEGVVPRDPEVTNPTPFRWLYVSSIDWYKHQDTAVIAAAELRRLGYALTLDFVGPPYASALRHLERVMRANDPARTFVRYLGVKPAAEMRTLYARYDGAVFPSSCESFGIPLVDGLLAGLPTACSSRSTLPEIAGDAAVFFDPFDPGTMIAAMRRIMDDPGLRATLRARGQAVARTYDWDQVADRTWALLATVARG